MQDTGNKLYLFYANLTINIEKPHSPCQKIQCSIRNSLPIAIKRNKWIYFSNIVSMTDLQQSRWVNYFHNNIFFKENFYTVPLYDCSLITGMATTHEINNVDSLNYFNFECYQQARYMFDRNQRSILFDMKEKGYPVPFPRELVLRIDSAVKFYQLMRNYYTKKSTFDYYGTPLAKLEYWWGKYLDFAGVSSNELRIIMELSLNCVTNFLSMAQTLFEDKIIERIELPDTFDTPLSYIQLMESILSYLNVANYKNESENNYTVITTERTDKIRNYFVICKKYLNFLWNNKEHIRTYWKFDKLSYKINRIRSRFNCHITLIDHLDPTLQKLMVRFINLTHAVSERETFISYQWGLSSGENILLRMFTKLWFVLQRNTYDEESSDTITKESAEKSPFSERKEAIVNALYSNYDRLHGYDRNKATIDCDSVILFLDEADLSFHPEWQRVFIATLTEYLPRLYQNPYYEGAKSGCRDIQIILTTHSPLLLGDFPAASVIYLKKDEKGFVSIDSNSKLQPFGQNLYTLLKDGFYLQNGTMGELARRKIASVLHDVQAIQSRDDSLQASLIDEISLDEWEKQLDDHLNKIVKYLPEGILRRKLEEEIAICRQIIWKKRNPDAKEREKQRLKEDIARLQQRLSELENGGESSQ